MGGFNFSSGSSRDRYPSWTAPYTRYAWTGQLPQHGEGSSGYGLFADVLAGGQAFPSWDVFSGLAEQAPNARAAGSMARDLAAQGTNQGWNNLSALAGTFGWDQLGNTLRIPSLIPQAMDTSNYYLNRGVTPAVQGGNVQGAMGAGQQVVDAALGAYKALPAEAYQRIVAEGLPEVRASYSARGLGTSGEAARGEQDYIQRTRDQLHQQDVANQIAALQTGAAASGAAASQAIGAQNAAIGRGQLGLGAANQIPNILGAFQDVAGSPLGYMQQFAGLQGLPLQLAGQGLGLYGAGLNLPLQYQADLYDFTRQPDMAFLSALSGLRLGNSRQWGAGGASTGGYSAGGSNNTGGNVNWGNYTSQGGGGGGMWGW